MHVVGTFSLPTPLNIWLHFCLKLFLDAVDRRRRRWIHTHKRTHTLTQPLSRSRPCQCLMQKLSIVVDVSTHIFYISFFNGCSGDNRTNPYEIINEIKKKPIQEKEDKIKIYFWVDEHISVVCCIPCARSACMYVCMMSALHSLIMNMAQMGLTCFDRIVHIFHAVGCRERILSNGVGWMPAVDGYLWLISYHEQGMTLAFFNCWFFSSTFSSPD